MKKITISFIVFFIISFNIIAQNVYVDSASTCVSGCNGLSWSSAYSHLQDALVSISSGDTIFVAKGTYYPDEGVGLVDNDRNIRFEITDSLSLFGGYPSGGGIRDIENNPTIFSGEIQQDNDSTNNTKHLVFINVNNKQVHIDGIKMVYAYLDTYNDRGAGIAIYGTYSNIDIFNCEFNSNFSSSWGGGLFVNLSSQSVLNLFDCSFDMNSADSGGALFNSSTQPTDSVKIERCVFSRNSSESVGSAIWNHQARANITNCSFTLNYGSAISSYQSTCIINNCSFYENIQIAINTGGAIRNHTASVNITNSIFWNNGNLEITNYNSTVGLGNCIIEESSSNNWNIDYGTDNGNNFDFNPFIITTDKYELLLDTCSRAINAGNNFNILNYNYFDILGNSRIYNNEIIDIGAFEYQGESVFVRIDSVVSMDIATCSDPYVSAQVFYFPTNPYDVLWTNNDTMSITDSLIDIVENWVFVCSDYCLDSAFVDIETEFNNGHLYVDSSATGIESGCSWTDACTKLQDALALATPGDSIFIAKGTYYTDEGLGLINNYEYYLFEIPDSVVVLGGYPGGGGLRDWNIYKTILSGEVQQDNDITNNSRVIYTENISSVTVVDGIIISDGDAMGYSYEKGAGWYNDGSLSNSPSNLIIRNCVFKNNHSREGGAMYNEGTGNNGSCTVSYYNCDFLNNVAIETHGGAVYNDARYDGSVIVDFEYCNFSNNSSTNKSGGAVYFDAEESSCSTSFLNCSFNDNSCSENGGAVGINADEGSSSSLFTNCTFSNNFADNCGGAISHLGSSGTASSEIIDCDFSDNIAAANYGGGVHIAFNGSACGIILLNSSFTGNMSLHGGAGFSAETNSSNCIKTIDNCLFVDNHQYSTDACNGGAIHIYMLGVVGETNISNCEFYGNSGYKGGAFFVIGINDNGKFYMNNCSFSKNIGGRGGGLYIWGSSSSINSNSFIQNCSFSGNSCAFAASSLYNNYATPVIQNSIFWDFGIEEIHNGGSSESIIKSCNIRGSGGSSLWDINIGIDGGNNLDVEPSFVDTANNNLQLQMCSRIIDAGDSTLYNLPSFDLAGDPRLYNNGQIDMGAYEYQDNPVFVLIDTVNVLQEADCISFFGEATVGYNSPSGSVDIWWDSNETGLIADSLGFGLHSVIVQNISSLCSDTATFIIEVDNSSGVMYVDENATGNNTGCSWQNAFFKLSDAIINSLPGDTIKVAQGTYYPDEFQGMDFDDQYLSFELPDSVVVFGGYPTGGGIRDWLTYETYLNGDIQQDSDSTNNTHHIFNLVNLSDETVIDGFIINNASNRAIYIDGTGINNNSSPIISNCKFINNWSFRGAAIYINGSYQGNAAPIISNCYFINNVSTDYGGAIYVVCSEGTAGPVIVNCVFSGNSAEELGGGLSYDAYQSINSSLEIINSSFSDNNALGGCGAMLIGGSNSVNFESEITNCVIWGNNDTIPSNQTELYESTGTIKIKNSLIKGSGGSSNWSLSFGVDMGGNIDGNPLFVDTLNHNLRLQNCSKVIDAGDNSSIPSFVDTDIDGNQRIFNSFKVDMGAYEYSLNPDFARIDSIVVNQDVECSTMTGLAEVYFDNYSSVFSILWDNGDTTNLADLTVGIHQVLLENNLSGCMDSLQITMIMDFGGAIYVDSSATGANSGCSWTNAFMKLQDAITRAKYGDTIYVAQGTYYPDEIGIINTDDRDIHFGIPEGVVILGGYPTGGGIRDYITFKTILSGDIQQDNDSLNNSHSLFFTDVPVQHFVLDGLTIIRGGNCICIIANQWYSETNIEVRNCTFSFNERNHGGSVYCHSGNNSVNSFEFTNCIFSNNYGSSGGAIFFESSQTSIVDLNITNCLFENNYSSWGGAILISSKYEAQGNVRISNCNFINNECEYMGGAIWSSEHYSLKIENCYFENNKATRGGAIYFLPDSDLILEEAVFESCTFINNTATDYGGAIHNGIWDTYSDPLIINNKFWNNSALIAGDAIANIVFQGSMQTRIVNNTMFSNPTNAFGGIIFSSGLNGTCSPIMSNCIVWGNPLSIQTQASSFSINNSIIEGSGGSDSWDTGIGIDLGSNWDMDPLFSDELSGDLHIMSQSPAIDAGDSNILDLPQYDLDGNIRIQDNNIDIGCYEYDIPSGLQENNIEENVSIFPNPTKDEVYIHSEIVIKQIELYTIGGRLLDVFNPNSLDVNLMMNEYNKGVYFIHIISDEGRIVRTVTKL